MLFAPQLVERRQRAVGEGAVAHGDVDFAQCVGHGGGVGFEGALLLGAAQILWLDIADHAAVDLSVRLVRADQRAAPYAGLVNAVLRRIARDGRTLLAPLDTTALDTPPWLMAR